MILGDVAWIERRNGAGFVDALSEGRFAVQVISAVGKEIVASAA